MGGVLSAGAICASKLNLLKLSAQSENGESTKKIKESRLEYLGKGPWRKSISRKKNGRCSRYYSHSYFSLLFYNQSFHHRRCNATLGPPDRVHLL